MSERIGYGRVSVRDQSSCSEHEALTEAGCAKMFIEKVSYRLDERPELARALDYARPGDVFVITRFVRAAWHLKEVIELIDALNERGIDLIVLQQNIDTTTPQGQPLFHLTAAFADFLRDLVIEGTLEGLETARARGRAGGRPAALTDSQISLARRMYDERAEDGKRRYTVQQIADTFGVARATIYRHLNPPSSVHPRKSLHEQPH